MKNIFVLLLFSFLFVGCYSDDNESILFDCILFPNRPVLYHEELPEGVRGEPYSGYVLTRMKNAKNDDFDYYFDIIGDIPPGLEVYQEGRRLEFSGIPERAGVFRFGVEVRTAYRYSSLCDENRDKKSYTIKIVR